MIINQIAQGKSKGKYALFDRVKNDSGTEFGTVGGFFIDANNTEYAIVCLDAQYRNPAANFLSTKVLVDGLPSYTNLSVYGATETATFNCDKILAQATTSETTSTGVSHCRSKSFIVDGTTYYGQLPNIAELLYIYTHRITLNTLDPTTTQYSNNILASDRNVLSSTQRDSDNCWSLYYTGTTSANAKTSNWLIVPILEIPNE